MDDQQVYNALRALGTFYAAPLRDPVQPMQPSYAETEADRIIAACQSNGEVNLNRLRALIVEMIEDFE